MSGFNDFFDFTLPSEISRMLECGNIQPGSRTVRRDIVDDNGNKIGEKVIHTFSSGHNRPAKEIVKASYPPVNIFTDENGCKVFEFACAGYDPKNISFEIDKEDPDYIDLVLSSGVKVEEDSTEESDEKKSKKAKKESEDEKPEVRAYEVEGFRVKDARVPFRVDNSRFNIEAPTVTFVNGVVRIAFEPKRINFAPKFLS